MSESAPLQLTYAEAAIVQDALYELVFHPERTAHYEADVHALVDKFTDYWDEHHSLMPEDD